MKSCRYWIFESGVSVLAAIIVAGSLAVPSAQAGTIIDDWNNVKVPPPPKLKSVTVDPKTTALLMLDFLHANCNDKRRPRCVASLPAMKELLAKAREHHLYIVYTGFGKHTPKDVWAQVAPQKGEPWITSHADKFIHTDLEKMLKDHGIKTVITVGTAAHGAVLYTASDAALRGFKVIIPVDGSTAENEYIEQYVVYNMAHAPGVSSNVTLTTSQMVKF